MARGTRRADVASRLTPRRLSWFGWFWGRVWFATKIAVCVSLVIGFLVWVLAQGYFVSAGDWAQDKLVAASGEFGLRVKDVSVEGRNHIDAETLKTTIGVQPGDPLMGVNLNELHARLTALPWIKQVRVRRAWQDRLIVISIDERQPIALWRDAPISPAVIDAEGVALTHANLASFGQLLAVDGPGSEKQAGALIELLKGQPDIAVRVKHASFISTRRWDLELDGGTIIRLPENDPGFALARISKAQTETKILDQKLKAVDLRQSDRIILEGAPGASGESSKKELKDGKAVKA